MAELDPDALEAIFELLRGSIGLSPASVGLRALDHALHHRMKDRAVADAAVYLGLLRSDPRELQRFIDEVVVPESWFFREVTPFECLRLFVRGWQAANSARRRLRLLSVPCSRGEEPYSMAMALLDMGLQPSQFEIVACDVSGQSLEIARRGVYRPLAFRERGEWTDRLQQRYFRDEVDGRVLDASVLCLVQFRRENLAAVDFLRTELPFDVIFCRNLLIYLAEESRRMAVSHLGRLLAPDGLLYFGHSECRHGRQMGLTPWHGQFPASFKHAATVATLPTARPRSESPGLASLISPVASGPRGKMVPGSLVPDASPSPASSPPRVAAPQAPAAPSGSAARSTDGIREAITKARELADRGRLDDADACCQRLQASHRFDPEVLCLRGVIQQARGDDRAAEQFFQQALFVVPDHREALTHLMLLSKTHGNDAQAANYQRRLDRIPARENSRP